MCLSLLCCVVESVSLFEYGSLSLCASKRILWVVSDSSVRVTPRPESRRRQTVSGTPPESVVDFKQTSGVSSTSTSMPTSPANHFPVSTEAGSGSVDVKEDTFGYGHFPIYLLLFGLSMPSHQWCLSGWRVLMRRFSYSVETID